MAAGFIGTIVQMQTEAGRCAVVDADPKSRRDGPR